jgi:hypothetical protein
MNGDVPIYIKVAGGVVELQNADRDGSTMKRREKTKEWRMLRLRNISTPPIQRSAKAIPQLSRAGKLLSGCWVSFRYLITGLEARITTEGASANCGVSITPSGSPGMCLHKGPVRNYAETLFHELCMWAREKEQST